MQRQQRLLLWLQRLQQRLLVLALWRLVAWVAELSELGHGALALALLHLRRLGLCFRRHPLAELARRRLLRGVPGMQQPMLRERPFLLHHGRWVLVEVWVVHWLVPFSRPWRLVLERMLGCQCHHRLLVQCLVR